jgi:hypothetical protein
MSGCGCFVGLCCSCCHCARLGGAVDGWPCCCWLCWRLMSKADPCLILIGSGTASGLIS